MTFDEYEDEMYPMGKFFSKPWIEQFSYCVMGLTGEAGEVANEAKRVISKEGSELNTTRAAKIKDELGDTLWYLMATAKTAGFTLEEVAAYNVKKLTERHG